jgi:hypothetical protein
LKLLALVLPLVPCILKEVSLTRSKPKDVREIQCVLLRELIDMYRTFIEIVIMGTLGGLLYRYGF